MSISPSDIMYPVFRPRLPVADKMLPYLRRIDDNRWYTNHGPLLHEFEDRLSRHFQIDKVRLATSSNATLAISQMLWVLGAKPGSLCVMPSWTFVATVAAVIHAGLMPYFVDVDPETWLISPAEVRRLAQSNNIGAVIVVSAFGAPLDIAPWEELTRSTTIPVLVDAAAGFDGFRGGLRPESTTPIVISMHATKVSGIGEGAVVLTGDEEQAVIFRKYGNFGFWGDRQASLPGINAKLSEYTAAMGLALLDDWPARREVWQSLSDDFEAEASRLPKIELAPGFNRGWISSYGLVRLPAGVAIDRVANQLKQRGIDTRQWWGRGCHEQPAYRHVGHGDLSVTHMLAGQVLGLPFWMDLNRDDFAHIFRALESALSGLE